MKSEKFPPFPGDQGKKAPQEKHRLFLIAFLILFLQGKNQGKIIGNRHHRGVEQQFHKACMLPALTEDIFGTEKITAILGHMDMLLYRGNLLPVVAFGGAVEIIDIKKMV